ncbi:MAG TPA: STM3941 family protein [Sphingomicrobium sp.]
MMELTAHSSPWRMVLIVAGALGFVAIGCWMAGLFGDVPQFRRWPPELVQLFGWFAILFFGLAALVAIRRIFDGGPQLTISAEGIRWKQWSDDLIPWSGIGDVTVWEFGTQKTILLHLVDPVRYPSRTLLGKLGGANRALTGGDIPISLTGLDKSFDESFAAIREFRQRR